MAAEQGEHMTMLCRSKTLRRVLAGVTMIELIVTIALGVIVSLVVIPNMTELIARNRCVASVNQLVGALAMARNEAIKRGVRVTLCKTSNPAADLAACDSSASWEDGWILYVENTHIAGNLLGEIDGIDVRLRKFQPMSGVTISTGENYGKGVYYSANGVVGGIKSSNAATLGNDTFQLQSDGIKTCVTINRIGRVSIRKEGESGC